MSLQAQPYVVDSTTLEMESALQKSEEKLKHLRSVLIAAQIEVTRWEGIVKIQREALAMTKGPLRQRGENVADAPVAKQPHTKWMPLIEEIIARVQRNEIERPNKTELIELLAAQRPNANSQTIYQFVTKALSKNELGRAYGFIYLKTEEEPK